MTPHGDDLGVGSSAVIAILLKEPGYQRLRDRLATSEQVSIGAPAVVESSLVLSSRLGRAGKTLLARFLQEAEIEEEQAMNLTGVWRIVEMDLWDADCLVSAIL